MTAPPPPCGTLVPEIHHSIDEIDKSSWDGILGSDDTVRSSSYLSLVERTVPGELDWRYLVLRSDGGAVAAHATFYETRLPLDVLVARSHPLARALAACRRVAPRAGTLRVIASGPPTAIGHAVSFRADLSADRRAEAVRRLLEAMRDLADRRRIRLLVVRDLRRDDRDLRATLAAEGLVELPNLDDTTIEVTWRSLDDYLTALRGRYRKLVRNHERSARDAGLRLERTRQWRHLADDMARLFATTAARHTAAAPPRADYFAGLEELGERTGVTLLWLDGSLVGFILYFVGDTTLTPVYLGVDYEVNRRIPLVFLAFYDMVRLAIEERVDLLRFGRTAYVAKMRLGARREPLSLYAAWGSGATTALAGSLARRLLPRAEREQWRAFRQPAGTIQAQPSAGGRST